MKIQVEHEFTDERISDFFCGMIEGNDMTRAWCHGLFLKHTDVPTDPGEAWYGQGKVFSKAWVIECHYDDPEVDEEGEGTGRFSINPNNFAEGLKRMSQKCRQHFSDLVNESEDAVTYDVLLQCVVLKDVVYG